MSWVRNIIILIKLLKRLRDSIIPNLERLERRITELNNDVEKLWSAVSFLSGELSNLKREIAETKGYIKGLDKALSFQQQINQILTGKLILGNNEKAKE